MAARLDLTTATGQSASFVPADETILQISAEDPTAKARVDDNAPWEGVGDLNPAINCFFIRLPQFPQLMVEIVRNTATKRIQVWDNA